jgi:pimeloyl-ACP methyl ester carboxylesterase
MPFFTRGGLKIAYDDIEPAGGGAGSVLLVHGFATNRMENWRRLGWYGAFERKDFRIIALDLRGHGESDKPHDPAAYGGGEHLADIVGLLDHLDVGRIDVLGYSMGARLALQLALGHGGRVANLIVGGVGGRMFEPPKPPEGPPMTMAEAMRAEDPEAIKDPTMRGFRIFAEQQGEDRLALAAFTEGRGGPGFTRDDLFAIAAPTLVVAGARDELAGDPQVLADAIRGAKSITLPGCDHFSAIPHALFKAGVFDFLEGWLDDDLPS